jgi:hypothetical protein
MHPGETTHFNFGQPPVNAKYPTYGDKRGRIEARQLFFFGCSISKTFSMLFQVVNLLLENSDSSYFSQLEFLNPFSLSFPSYRGEIIFSDGQNNKKLFDMETPDDLELVDAGCTPPCANRNEEWQRDFAAWESFAEH